MEIIYKNDYGATYLIKNSRNPTCELQLVIGTVGLFMSSTDLDHLLSIVTKSHEPFFCEDCGGPCNKIWCTNPLIDICIKVDGPILNKMEDLIKGTQFILNINDTLDEFRLNPED